MSDQSPADEFAEFLAAQIGARTYAQQVTNILITDPHAGPEADTTNEKEAS